MKTTIIVVWLLVLCSCQGKVVTTHESPSTNVEDILVKPSHVAASAKLINLGFADVPVYVWIEFIGHYKEKRQIYDHIYGIKHTYYNQNHVDTSFYETAFSRRSHLSEDGINNANLVPYPGDVTYGLIHRRDTTFLFIVMQKDTQVIDGKTWQMNLPLVKLHNKGEKISNDAVDVRIDTIKDDVFLVSLIGERGKKKIKFKLHGDCAIDTRMSYLDQSEGRIYFVPKDCYLELVDKRDIVHL